LTSLTFETEVPVDRDWSTPFGVYHYDARGATEECADLLGQQFGIEAVPQERIRTAEELGVHQHQIAAAISLLAGGATVPFVAG
jgi:hypothetical protein